ncbi:MAG: HNH endonuclease [Candidatus Nanopelagicales bacterium]
MSARTRQCVMVSAAGVASLLTTTVRAGSAAAEPSVVLVGTSVAPGADVSMSIGPVWSVLSSSPWALALFAIGLAVITSRLYQRVRWVHLALQRRDPVRRFPAVARAAILSRAGHRCEHRYAYLLRCRATKQLEADHIHPHSRGGSTTLGNAQALCSQHNRLKGARIPFTWELRLLNRLRGSYFPRGMDTAIVRREGARRRGPRNDYASRLSDGQLPKKGSQPTESRSDSMTAPRGGGAQQPSAADVLAAWLSRYAIELTEWQRHAFLAHAAMPEILRHQATHIEIELRHHQKLDELAAALGLRCHLPREGK